MKICNRCKECNKKYYRDNRLKLIEAYNKKLEILYQVDIEGLSYNDYLYDRIIYSIVAITYSMTII